MYRMCIRQENRLAPISVKISKQLALADYRQSLKLNNKNVKEIIVRQDTSRLSPAMQGYYWGQMNGAVPSEEGPALQVIVSIFCLFRKWKQRL